MYKIVRNINGKLYSSNTTGDYEIEYKLGEFVKPKIGKLFVFYLLEHAKRFRSFMDYEIYTCECINPRYHPLPVLCNDEIYFDAFWNSNYIEYNHIMFPPDYYYCADEVKLIEKVS